MDDFYRSKEWRNIRYDVIRVNNARCMACGRSPQKHGIVIHVDHKIPRYVRPDLALSRDNLQLLCEDCNLGKSFEIQDDWTGNCLIKKSAKVFDIKKSECTHQPYWENKIEKTIFKNNTTHFKMTCSKCGRVKHINRALGQKLIS